MSRSVPKRWHRSRPDVVRSLRRLGVDRSRCADAAVRRDGQSAIPSGVLTSTPAPGASAPAAPRAIQVTFSGALDSASRLSLVYLPVVPSIDDISRDVRVTSRLASSDPEGRTLEVIPPRLGKGLYLVRWTAYPQFGGVIRHGSFAFGVGVAVPPDNDGVTYSLRERDSGDRGRRITMLGGVVLLVLGGLSWYRFSLVQ